MLGDAVKEWSLSERILVATRLLDVVEEDLSSGRYGAPGGLTVSAVVAVLNAPAEVLDERRGFYSAVLTGGDPRAHTLVWTDRREEVLKKSS